MLIKDALGVEGLILIADDRCLQPLAVVTTRGAAGREDESNTESERNTGTQMTLTRSTTLGNTHQAQSEQSKHSKYY